LHGIPLEQVGSGAIWDYDSGRWRPEEYEQLPTTVSGSLLLVPKVIVRRRLDYDPGEYYTKYILRYYQQLEETSGSALVRTLKSGKRRVLLRDLRPQLKRRFGSEKKALIQATVKSPQLLDNYRKDKDRPDLQRTPLTLEEITREVDGSEPNWTKLLESVTNMASGPAALLTAVFYPGLVSPKIEREIDQGRKRIDIRYTSSGVDRDFFSWIQTNFPPQPFVYAECKNYSDDLGNEELDQLTGRFNLGSGSGNLGLLVSRRFNDKARFVQRCRDAALKGRGFVLALDDEDLISLTHARANDDAGAIFSLLSGRFAELVE
jgi:hypothetical protein